MPHSIWLRRRCRSPSLLFCCVACTFILSIYSHNTYTLHYYIILLYYYFYYVAMGTTPTAITTHPRESDSSSLTQTHSLTLSASLPSKVYPSPAHPSINSLIHPYLPLSHCHPCQARPGPARPLRPSIHPRVFDECRPLWMRGWVVKKGHELVS